MWGDNPIWWAYFFNWVEMMDIPKATWNLKRKIRKRFCSPGFVKGLGRIGTAEFRRSRLWAQTRPCEDGLWVSEEEASHSGGDGPRSWGDEEGAGAVSCWGGRGKDAGPGCKPGCSGKTTGSHATTSNLCHRNSQRCPREPWRDQGRKEARRDRGSEVTSRGAQDRRRNEDRWFLCSSVHRRADEEVGGVAESSTSPHGPPARAGETNLAVRRRASAERGDVGERVV